MSDQEKQDLNRILFRMLLCKRRIVYATSRKYEWKWRRKRMELKREFAVFKVKLQREVA